MSQVIARRPDKPLAPRADESAGRQGEGTGARLADGAASPVHAVDARAKILGFIGFTVVVVTTPPLPAWPFVLYAVILAFVAALARVSPARLAKRVLVVVPFIIAVAVFLPLYRRAGDVAFALGPLEITEGGLLVLWNAGGKALLGVVSMILLTSTTSFSELVEGFERLRAPRVVVLTVSFMHRYGYLFLEESRRMQRAMSSRSFRAHWLGNVPTLGHMLGALFLRSYGRAERVYVAMLSRGYENGVGLARGGPFRTVDALFLGSMLLAAVAVRVSASVWGAG